MNATIAPSHLSGTIQAPASKSHAHRLFIAAALADKDTILYSNTTSVDIEVTIQCLIALGASIRKESAAEESGAVYHITPICKGSVSAAPVMLDCKESGSTLRFLLPIAAALQKEVSFTGAERLAQRPLSPLYEEMQTHGAVLGPQGSFPLSVGGALSPGTYTLSGKISSQFFTGLLFALPLLGADSEILITDTLESASYVQMTLDIIKQFGIKISWNGKKIRIPGKQSFLTPNEVTVEGDWSNAAFWLCAGALGSDPVCCTGLNLQSSQGDRAILSVLEQFGAKITRNEDSATVTPQELHAITIDASDIPDLVPILSVVAASAQGTTKIINAERLRLKESDRLSTVSELLCTLGIDVIELQDALLIEGGKMMKGGKLTSHNDHRIAMSTVIASLTSNAPILLMGAEAVNKSYPTFYQDFEKLGGNFILEQ